MKQEFLQEPLRKNLIKMIERYSVSEALIGWRWTEFCDEKKGYLLSQGENIRGAEILERTQAYSSRADQILEQLYFQDESPSHLLHVTCTGYASPSAAQKLVARKGWNQTEVTHAYHMGCYAALPTLRLADALARSGTPRVDIVHTEMCSLHMDPLAHDPEQIVIQSLFSDGHIKYSVKPADSWQRGFRVKATLERILPESSQDMTWTPAAWGMQMSLSRKVPEKIQGAVGEFVAELLVKARVDPDYRDAVFAVHPGGPKIIQYVQDALQLGASQVEASKKVLFERGNMSSATLPHIWSRLFEQELPNGKTIISLAFGPGLTMFGSVFEVCA